jgi:hypothetical protein
MVFSCWYCVLCVKFGWKKKWRAADGEGLIYCEYFALRIIMTGGTIQEFIVGDSYKTNFCGW